MFGRRIEENRPYCHNIYYMSYMNCARIEPGPDN
jgi:hypothetical protein